jgi:ABC-type multidrug transport system fused ATPase/permease subunit
MSKKTILSIFLILLGVISGLLIIFAYSMSGGRTSITLAFLSIAIVCIIVGSILAFSRRLDRIVSPVVEEIHSDIEDDLQDLKEHQITNTIWMIIIIGIALLVFPFFVFRFHKVEAMWGSIPVVILTVIGMGLLAWFIPRTNWFRNSRSYTSMWIYLIPTIGFIITIWIGLANTENLGMLRTSPKESIGYNTYQSTGFILQTAGDVGGSGLSLDLPDCDGDACAVYLVIELVLLVFVLMIGSALIPHFWLFSGSILLGIMALIAIHDLRIRRSLDTTLKMATNT